MNEGFDGFALERRGGARYAEAAFHQNYNDVDVYIEDTAVGYRKIFSILLNRALAGRNIALERVFPLGSRGEVIAAARKDAESNGRRSIFIVDGDLYLLAGDGEMLGNIVALPVYCVENFLVDARAIVELMNEESAELSASEVEARYMYSDWHVSSVPLLKELFLWFAVSHKLGAGLKTVSRGYASIAKNDRGDLDEVKVVSIVNELKVALNDSFGEDAVKAAHDFVVGKVDGDRCFLSTYVSAKDFTLPLLSCRMRSSVGFRVSNLSLKLRLAKLCKVDLLSDIARRVAEMQKGEPIGVAG